MTSMMQKKNERYLHKEWTNGRSWIFFSISNWAISHRGTKAIWQGNITRKREREKKYRARRAIKKQWKLSGRSMQILLMNKCRGQKKVMGLQNANLLPSSKHRKKKTFLQHILNRWCNRFRRRKRAQDKFPEIRPDLVNRCQFGRNLLSTLHFCGFSERERERGD